MFISEKKLKTLYDIDLEINSEIRKAKLGLIYTLTLIAIFALIGVFLSLYALLILISACLIHFAIKSARLRFIRWYCLLWIETLSSDEEIKQEKIPGLMMLQLKPHIRKAKIDVYGDLALPSNVKKFNRNIIEIQRILKLHVLEMMTN